MAESLKQQDETCSVKFFQLCEFLESLNQQRQKKQQLKEFFLKNKDKIKNFFPIVRLMLPAFDTERTSYGYKEKKLAKLYGSMLSLPHDLATALKDFKKPQPLIPNFPSGDFTQALEFILKPRLSTPGNQLRIDQVNEYLNKFSDQSQSNRDDLFRELLKKMNVTEHK